MNIALEKRTEHNEKQDYHYRIDCFPFVVDNRRPGSVYTDFGR